MTLTIDAREILPGEVVQLQEIARQTFFETFASVNTAENMQQYLHEKFSLQKLKEELSDPDSEFYFVLLEGVPMGYLKLNFGQSQTEIRDGSAVEVERIYVLKAFQDKKAGQALFEKAMERASQRNMDYIWLGVWENNHRAIGFYEKNGFEAFDQHIFRLGNDVQTDIMMRRWCKAV